MIFNKIMLGIMVSLQKFLMNFPREKTKDFLGREKEPREGWTMVSQVTMTPNTVNQRKIRPRYELIFPTNPTIHSLQSDLIIVGLIGTPTPVFTVCIT